MVYVKEAPYRVTRKVLLIDPEKAPVGRKRCCKPPWMQASRTGNTVPPAESSEVMHPAGWRHVWEAAHQPFPEPFSVRVPCRLIW